jgi:hypothetical protein
MEFNEQKTAIQSLLKRGDLKTIAKKAHVSTVTVWNALTKESIAAMTNTEKAVWTIIIDHLKTRQEENSRLEDRINDLTHKL